LKRSPLLQIALEKCPNGEKIKLKEITMKDFFQVL